MQLEKQMLWIIAGGGVQSIADGTQDFFPAQIGDKDHISRCRRYCDKYGIDYPGVETHDGYAKLFNSLGLITVYNTAQPIDGKYIALFFMPEKLTEKQIEFMDSIEEFLYEKYDPLLTDCVFYTTKQLDYNTDKEGYRNLKIEKLIVGEKPGNNIDLLFEEIARQKEEYYTK